MMGRGGAVEETLSRLAQLRHVQAAEKDLAADAKAFLANMENLAKRVFARSRLTVYLSDNVSPSGDFEKLVDAFPGGVVASAVVRKPFPRRREGFSVASESAYAAKASHLAQVGAGTTGSGLVAARLLSLTYLWDEIRVKGRASRRRG